MAKETKTPESKFKLTRNKIILFSVGTVALVGSAIAVPAIASNNMAQHIKIAMSDSNGAQAYKAGWGSHKRSHFSKMSDAELEKRITKIVRHMSVEIDATEAQEKQIVEIALATAKKMKPLRAEFKAAGFELAKLLTADNIDRPAIETLRAERVIAADQISKTILDAISDVSEILSTEQRKDLAQRVKRFQSRFDD